MHIRLGYDLRFETLFPTPVVALLSVHPSCKKDLLKPDLLRLEPNISVSQYIDTFSNRGTRFVGPLGSLALSSSFVVEDSGQPDPQNPDALEAAVEHLPHRFFASCYPAAIAKQI